ncbi:hypothetical protein ADEAN_000882000 [Angomonas deanei]|uniref:C2H2-type domain-containing protein n=1 Tax=Angomonas deanei TaxID=59799 RepID=A0A7G2CN68_9TRYP|nr:hypothetical protein ADEAN_000882000 [Angomonas deanei]
MQKSSSKLRLKRTSTKEGVTMTAVEMDESEEIFEDSNHHHPNRDASSDPSPPEHENEKNKNLEQTDQLLPPTIPNHHHHHYNISNHSHPDPSPEMCLFSEYHGMNEAKLPGRVEPPAMTISSSAKTDAPLFSNSNDTIDNSASGSKCDASTGDSPPLPRLSSATPSQYSTPTGQPHNFEVIGMLDSTPPLSTPNNSILKKSSTKWEESLRSEGRTSINVTVCVPPAALRSTGEAPRPTSVTELKNSNEEEKHHPSRASTTDIKTEKESQEQTALEKEKSTTQPADHPHHSSHHNESTNRLKSRDDLFSDSVTCEICGKRFLNAKGVAIHKGKMHVAEMFGDCEDSPPHIIGNSGSTIQKDITSSSFDNEEEIIKYNKIEEDPFDDSATCDICGKVCLNARGVAIHKGKMHVAEMFGHCEDSPPLIKSHTSSANAKGAASSAGDKSGSTPTVHSSVSADPPQSKVPDDNDNHNHKSEGEETKPHHKEDPSDDSVTCDICGEVCLNAREVFIHKGKLHVAEMFGDCEDSPPHIRSITSSSAGHKSSSDNKSNSRVTATSSAPLDGEDTDSDGETSESEVLPPKNGKTTHSKIASEDEEEKEDKSSERLQETTTTESDLLAPPSLLDTTEETTDESAFAANTEIELPTKQNALEENKTEKKKETFNDSAMCDICLAVFPNAAALAIHVGKEHVTETFQDCDDDDLPSFMRQHNDPSKKTNNNNNNNNKVAHVPAVVVEGPVTSLAHGVVSRMMPVDEPYDSKSEDVLSSDTAVYDDRQQPGIPRHRIFSSVGSYEGSVHRPQEGEGSPTPEDVYSAPLCFQRNKPVPLSGSDSDSVSPLHQDGKGSEVDGVTAHTVILRGDLWPGVLHKYSEELISCFLQDVDHCLDALLQRRGTDDCEFNIENLNFSFGSLIANFNVRQILDEDRTNPMQVPTPFPKQELDSCLRQYPYPLTHQLLQVFEKECSVTVGGWVTLIGRYVQSALATLEVAKRKRNPTSLHEYDGTSV